MLIGGIFLLFLHCSQLFRGGHCAIAPSLQTPCKNQRQLSERPFFKRLLYFWDKKLTKLEQIQSCKFFLSLFGQMLFRSNVVSIKCRFDLVSFRSNVVLIKCHFDQMLFDQVSFDQLSGHMLRLAFLGRLAVVIGEINRYLMKRDETNETIQYLVLYKTFKTKFYFTVSRL